MPKKVRTKGNARVVSAAYQIKNLSGNIRHMFYYNARNLILQQDLLIMLLLKLKRFESFFYY